MKKLTSALAVLAIALCSCASYSLITGSWKNSLYNNKSYDRILVAALTSHPVAKSAMENDIWELLVKDSLKVSRSIDMFPPKMNVSDTDKVDIMKGVKGKNIEAILTITIQRKETETRYVPGNTYYPYSYGYPYGYRNYWGYYSYWYPSYTPGYYTESTVYYLESNFYDVKTEELVWSAQSKTYESPELASFSKDFAKEIVARLKQEGLLRRGAADTSDRFGSR
ncbi:MAG: hypothetical protein ACJ76F_08340 [Bacteroidia bacterium]